MVVRKRKKNTRQHGGTYHGWGLGQGHHKGAGNRGGHGHAGTGKKAATKKINFAPRHYGKCGFKKKGVIPDIKPVNLQYLNELLIHNKIKDTVNLSDLGFNKLLGKGRLSKKLKIIAESASSNAVEKVKAAGGEVILPAENKEVVNEPAEKHN